VGAGYVVMPVFADELGNLLTDELGNVLGGA
jgi:hypothetical protein